MAETHHSANYDQAFPCRRSSAGNGKSLFSHTPMEAMGHGAMQMRCVYKHVYTYTDAHTNTCKQVSSLTLHARAVLTPTLVWVKNTNTLPPFTPHFPLDAGCQPFVHSLAHKCRPLTLIHNQAAPHKHIHTHKHINIIRVSVSPRMHWNVIMILSIKFAPTEPSYPSLL